MNPTSDAVPNQPINETTLGHLRNRQSTQHKNKFTSNKAALSFVFIILLMVGLAAGLMLIKNQRSTQTDTKAAGGVTLSMISTPNSGLEPLSTFVVDVIMNPHNEDVTAIELHVDYDQTKFEPNPNPPTGEVFEKTDYFQRVLPNCKVDPTANPCPEDYFIDQTNGMATLYLGANCTESSCENREGDSDEHVIARLHLRVKEGATGNGAITFKTAENTSGQYVDYETCLQTNNGLYTDSCEGTWIASTDGEYNRGSNTIATQLLNISINGTSNACQYDFNGINGIDIQDIMVVANIYGSELGDSNYNPDYDFNNANGIDIQDIMTVAQYFGTSCEN